MRWSVILCTMFLFSCSQDAEPNKVDNTKSADVVEEEAEETRFDDFDKELLSTIYQEGWVSDAVSEDASTASLAVSSRRPKHGEICEITKCGGDARHYCPGDHAIYRWREVDGKFYCRFDTCGRICEPGRGR